MKLSLCVRAALLVTIFIAAAQPTNIGAAPFILALPASPAPTPPEQKSKASQEPLPIVSSLDNTIYILVASGDASLAAAVSLEVAMNLSKRVVNGDVATAGMPVVVPQPAWTLSDLGKQCAADANTRGAIVVGPIENDTGTWNSIIYLHGYTRLTADVTMVACEPPVKSLEKTAPGVVAIAGTGKPTRTLQVEWSSRFVGGDGNQGGISLLPLAVVGALFAYHVPTITQPSTVTTSTVGSGASPEPSGTSVAQNSLGWTNNASTFGSDIGSIAAALPALSTTQLPGINNSTLLSRAANTIATRIGDQITIACAPADTDKHAQQACLRLFSGKGVQP